MSSVSSPRPQVVLIAAMSDNRVIGRHNQLPWHLPADLKHFKRLTTGHTVIMGRKTFESFGTPLPQRRNIVVTRNVKWLAPGVDVAHSLEEALQMAAGDGEVFIAGGEQIYQAALPRAERIYLTRVHGHFEGDASFPIFEGPQWTLRERSEHPADEKHACAMTFETYDRVKS
jgi:dihydrofolate reductase